MQDAQSCRHVSTVGVGAGCSSSAPQRRLRPPPPEGAPRTKVAGQRFRHASWISKPRRTRYNPVRQLLSRGQLRTPRALPSIRIWDA